MQEFNKEEINFHAKIKPDSEVVVSAPRHGLSSAARVQSHLSRVSVHEHRASVQSDLGRASSPGGLHFRTDRLHPNTEPAVALARAPARAPVPLIAPQKEIGCSLNAPGLIASRDHLHSLYSLQPNLTHSNRDIRMGGIDEGERAR